MATDKEKVCDIVREMKSLAESGGSKRRVNIPTLTVHHWIGLADRIESAHKREVAELKTAYDRAVSADARHAVENERLKGEVTELRECLKEAINLKCKCCGYIVYEGDTDISKSMSFTGESDCGKIDGTCFVQKWRKALEGGAK